MNLTYEQNNKERVPLEHYKALYSKLDPQEVVERCGVSFENSEFTVWVMGRNYHIAFPEFSVRAGEGLNAGKCSCDVFLPANVLLIRYLLEGKLTQAKGEQLTYREIPWGEVYYPNFYGRCIQRTAFGFKPASLAKAAEKLGSKKLTLGDISYEVEFMKGLCMSFILWEADDEFPPSAQILLSDNFSSAFTAEDIAVVGDICIGILKELSK